MSLKGWNHEVAVLCFTPSLDVKSFSKTKNTLQPWVISLFFSSLHLTNFWMKLSVQLLEPNLAASFKPVHLPGWTQPAADRPPAERLPSGRSCRQTWALRGCSISQDTEQTSPCCLLRRSTWNAQGGNGSVHLRIRSDWQHTVTTQYQRYATVVYVGRKLYFSGI